MGAPIQRVHKLATTIRRVHTRQSVLSLANAHTWAISWAFSKGANCVSREGGMPYPILRDSIKLFPADHFVIGCSQTNWHVRLLASL
jgi:hypothetical protein